MPAECKLVQKTLMYQTEDVPLDFIIYTFFLISFLFILGVVCCYGLVSLLTVRRAVGR